MKLLLFALSLAGLTYLMQAQTPKAAVDPISGTWKGDMAPKGEANRHPIVMELKFDGATSVSGTVSGGDTFEIKAGTFDPKTGALKLEVSVTRDGAVSPFVFEGTVVQGTASGRVTGDNQTGDFKVTKSPSM